MIDVMTKRLSDGWQIAVGDGSVTQIIIDYRLGLNITVDVGVSILVAIEGGFTYTHSSGAESVEWEYPTELGRFAFLHGEDVSDLYLADSGAMTIRFAGGMRIDVAPDPQYEAFEVSSGRKVSAGGFMFVSMPGGGLRVWQGPGLTITRLVGGYAACSLAGQTLESIGTLPRRALVGDLFERGWSEADITSALTRADAGSVTQTEA